MVHTPAVGSVTIGRSSAVRKTHQPSAATATARLDDERRVVVDLLLHGEQ